MTLWLHPAPHNGGRNRRHFLLFLFFILFKKLEIGHLCLRLAGDLINCERPPEADVAQLVEQPIRNRQVSGSSPLVGSISFPPRPQLSWILEC
jgi:hypothetical protein